MADVNPSQQNFAAGELSANMRGRFDLPIYANGSERFKNFIAELQGPSRFRNGFKFVHHTRRNAVAVLIPFQFNDSQSYLIELTAGYMRFYRDEGIITQTALVITAITKANPGVVTSNGHGYSNGDEVAISGVVGMTEVNNRSYVVAGVTANTFQLTDSDGNNVNTTNFTTYTSGGTCAKIVEITTPYTVTDLYAIKYTQNADTMYLVHPYYEPRKLTRASHTSWTLALFTRTSDPFLSKKVITGISQANPGNVTSVAHGLSTGDVVIIEAVVGMTQVNGRYYTITVTGVDNFTIGIDTSGYTAWSSAGYASLRNLLPSAIAFYESRLIYGASDSKPETMWGSRTPTAAGVARYDDFTTGTDADHAFIFTLAPSTGKVNRVEWFSGTDKFLGIGTFGGVSKADGGNSDDSISPTNINVRPVSNLGVADIMPISLGGAILYVQRSGQTITSLEFDALADSFIPIDRNLVSEDISKLGIIQLVYQNARPDLAWGVRSDGVFLGLTYKSREDVSGWHRHSMGGTSPKVLSMGCMPRTSEHEQIWAVVERTVNSLTRRYVEFMADNEVMPERDDYFTDEDSEDDDDATWRRAMFESQKEYIFVDSALTFDGSDLGTIASATMTPAAVTGSDVIFTASAAVFKSTDVGRQIWKKASNGVGYGRAEIISFTSTTVVHCEILQDFNNVTAMAAGSWFLTSASISGLWHLVGQTVSITADGGEHPTEIVSATGTVTLDYQVSKCHIGLAYTGFTKSMAVEAGGINGPAVAKMKNINRMGIRFLNTLGARYGTSLYKMEEIDFRSTEDNTGQPPPLFSGVKQLSYEDMTVLDKHVYIQQTKPLPCIVLAVSPVVDTDNF